MSVSPQDSAFSKALEAISALKSGERCAVPGLLNSSKAFFIARLFEKRAKSILIITPTQEEAEDFTKDINFFLGTDAARFYPSWETLPFETQSPHPDITAVRIAVLYKLKSGERQIVVTVPSAILQRVPSKDDLSVLKFEMEKEINRDEVLQQLINMGYSRASLVEERGEMRVAGGILDIFPPSYSTPVRIEFFGDEVESIRTFDIATQRSKEEMKEAEILPAREAKDKWLNTFFDYLSEDCLCFLDNPENINDEIAGFESEIQERKIQIEQKEDISIRPEEFYLSADELKRALEQKAVISLESFAGKGIELSTESNLDIRQDIATRKEEILKPLADRIKDWRDLGWSVFLVCHTTGQAERLKELLEGYRLNAVLNSEFRIPNSELSLLIGNLSSGFRFHSVKIAFVTEEEIFGQKIKRRLPPSHKIDAFLTQLQDLNIGDFIVHTIHGIGIYKGLKRLKIEDIENDFLVLEYQGGDKLYLPVQRLHLVGKYRGVEGKRPEIDKLGSTKWEKTKGRVKKIAEDMAKGLLELYAARKVVEGFSFSKGDRLFSEFEASFDYDETPDQLSAIEDVLKDMEEPRPMDRLVCGDVGYGKTEVAMRAAFKAVLDNRQAAVLVPTTVLAQQHYLTFKNRFAAYPVTIEVLSRFRSTKEQKCILKRLANGEVDIIIGTHRLLQKDVVLKDLGLIIVDEEHRFGVSHKERLKQMKRQVDVLTLTATPIPRTLHMSLAGIRDLSIINTPPEDRLAIKTVVARFDDDLIRDAVRRELTRGGQVFFVHNRVESIAQMADYLKRLVPEARIAVAHGQMKEKGLEKVMADFINKGYDILLSTSIIESGLDIPSANTILINRADRFGLAEVYQLRGRVGRSNHRAYAYLLTPPELTLAEDAKKRLKVLQELSDLGAGFRLAAYDLEIRGAGELLGAKQSGQIAEVGFEMYTQLLEDAIKELKGENIEKEIEPEINLKVSAYIPENYIPDERQRLSIYKRIATAASLDGITALKEELIDRFGDIPELLNNLFRIAGLKLLLKKLKITELSQKGDYLYITFSNDTSVAPQQLLQLVKKNPKRFRLTSDSKFIVLAEKGKEIWEEARYILQQMAAG